MKNLLIAQYETLEFILADLFLAIGGYLLGTSYEYTNPLAWIGSVFLVVGFWLGFRVLKKFQNDLKETKNFIHKVLEEANRAHEKISKASDKIKQTQLYLDSTMADLKKTRQELENAKKQFEQLKKETEVNTRKLADRIDPQGY